MNFAISNFLGFISASRVPNLVMIGMVQLLTAVFLLGQSWESLTTLSFLALLFATLMIAAGGYIINDYYDQKIDMINRPEKVVVGITLQRRLAMLAHFVLSIIAVGLGFRIGIFIGAMYALAIFGLWFYSNHLRRLPIIGNLTIAFMHSMVILVTMVFFREMTKVGLAYAFFAFTISLIREIIKDIQDVKGESAFGCSTIPVVWGIRGAKYVIYFFSLIGVIMLTTYLLVGASDPVKIYFAIVSPFFLWFLFKIHRADTQKEYQSLHQIINALILSGIVSIIFV